MKAVCKTCGIAQVREKIAQTKTMSVFVNDKGEAWHGRLCPQCNVKRSNKNMRKLRSRA